MGRTVLKSLERAGMELNELDSSFHIKQIFVLLIRLQNAYICRWKKYLLNLHRHGNTSGRVCSDSFGRS